MRVAVISDTHFGYARFEEDAFVQAENAFLDAQEKADLIIYAGDVFDIKVPKLETIHRTIDILRKVRIPIYAIHGNHERRSKDMINPVELLAQMGLVKHVHGKDIIFEKNGKKLQIFGLGNIPEDFARVALEQALKGFNPQNDAFKILVLHQSIKELIPQAEDEISTDDLEELPFDLIINGHIHKHSVLMGGKLLIPGSTVITQLKKDEMMAKGYILYDTDHKKYEFVNISCRPFFFDEMSFQQATMQEVREAVMKKAKELRAKNNEAIVRIKVTGSLKEGLNNADFDLNIHGIYVDNELENEGLKANLEKIRKLRDEKMSVKEIAVRELKEKTKDIRLFDSLELFDKLMQGTEEAGEYLQQLRRR